MLLIPWCIKFFKLTGKDELEVSNSRHLGAKLIKWLNKEIEFSKEVEEVVAALESLQVLSDRYTLSCVELPIPNKRLLPSVIQAPQLELKSLLDHMKYVYLGQDKMLLVIIAQDLTQVQEEKLIRVLGDHKTTIGWTIVDIKGIIPSMCMH